MPELGMGLSHIAHLTNMLECDTMLWYEKEFNMMSQVGSNVVLLLPLPVYTRLKASYRLDMRAFLRCVEARCAKMAACM